LTWWENSVSMFMVEVVGCKSCYSVSVDPFLLSSVDARSTQFHNVTVNIKLLILLLLVVLFVILLFLLFRLLLFKHYSRLWTPAPSRRSVAIFFPRPLFFVLVIFESCSNSFPHLLRGLSLFRVSSTVAVTICYSASWFCSLLILTIPS